MKPTSSASGGGSVEKVESSSSSQSVQQLIEQLEIAYHNSEYLEPRLPQLNPSVEEMYRDLIKGEPGSEMAKNMLHTKYHVREKTVASAIADW